MRGKSIFKTIFIFGVILWSLYTLWPSYRIMTLSEEKRKQLEESGDIESLLKKSIKLGLDLQGGMYLVYEVDFPVLIEQLARNKDSQLEELLKKTKEELNVSNDDFLTILQKNFREKNIPLNRYWGERGASDRRVLDYLDKEAKDGVKRALRKLENRINRFGVSEPTIQKLGNRRILIELPGVSNPERAKNLIKQTALLEFRLLKDPRLFSETLDKIDKLIASERGLAQKVDTSGVADTTVAQKVSKDKEISVSELFGKSLTPQEGEKKEDTTLVVDEELFNKKPFLSLFRDLRRYGHEVCVQRENVKAVDRILKREDVQKLLPPDSEFLWSEKEFRVGDRYYRELFFVRKQAEITGKYLTSTRVTIGSGTKYAGMPEVHFTLNRTGARIFKRVTGANIGKPLAVILDGQVVDAPRIESEIPNGQSRITGIGSMEKAKDLANVLDVGALPAPIHPIEERNVGPSLGEDSINKGKWSALIGLSLVIIFMVIYYRMSGIVADIALVLNLIILMAILAQFRFTLTLPGVAGMVLTIGMAVDANVLVFERIREELRTGKTVRASIDAGYSRAFRTIFDANITTLLTAIVLYQFGTGPVRGFAVTLSVGIIVSMFTALVVTRYIFDRITSRFTLKKLSI